MIRPGGASRARRLLAVVPLLLVVACSGGGDDATDQSGTPPVDPPATTAPEPTAPEPTAQPGPTDPTAPTDPTGTTGTTGPAPATGPALALEPVSLRLPQGWRAQPSVVGFEVSGEAPGRLVLDQVVVGVLPAYATSELDLIEAQTLRGYRPAVSEVRERVVVDGVELVHVAGVVRSGGPAETYAGVAPVAGGARLVSIVFLLDGNTPRAERGEIVETVMASVEFG